MFVNLDGKAPEFETFIAPIATRYSGYDLSQFRVAKQLDFEFARNWKLAFENFCDVYHVFKVHSSLDEMQTPAERFAMEPDGVHLFNWYPFAGDGRGLTLDTEGALPDLVGLSESLGACCNFCGIFPNSTMTIYPSNLQFVTFEPLGAQRCIMHMWFYFVGDTVGALEHKTARQTVYAEWTNLNAEDEDVCHRLQLGRQCDAYDGGRLAPYWDTGTVHFHKQIANTIRADSPGL